jgi:DNA-binding GntR family transcriptional regulator
LLIQRRGPTQLSREYGLDHTTVRRAIRDLEAEDLVVVLRGDRRRLELGVVPMPTPPEIMAEVLRGIEDLRALRVWLASDAARAALGRCAHLDYTLGLLDMSRRWAEVFTATHSKLMESLTLDSWLHDMLKIIEEAAPGAKPKILERVRRGRWDCQTHARYRPAAHS